MILAFFFFKIVEDNFHSKIIQQNSFFFYNKILQCKISTTLIYYNHQHHADNIFAINFKVRNSFTDIALINKHLMKCLDAILNFSICFFFLTLYNFKSFHVIARVCKFVINNNIAIHARCFCFKTTTKKNTKLALIMVCFSLKLRSWGVPQIR